MGYSFRPPALLSGPDRTSRYETHPTASELLVSLSNTSSEDPTPAFPPPATPAPGVQADKIILQDITHDAVNLLHAGTYIAKAAKYKLQDFLL
jgi:hypothetical protein